jgi:hypothetical protein
MTKYRFAVAVLLMFIASAVSAESVPTPEKMISEGSYEGTPWLSGGVGEGEREYLLQEYGDDFNLKLEFAVAQGSYLADVGVLIAKPTGEVVMNTLSKGPWFMTKLPPGTYRVRATGLGESFEKTVQFPATGLHTVVFKEWTKAEVAKETPGPTY